MKRFIKFLSLFLSIWLTCFSAVGASYNNCANEEYKTSHPKECKFFIEPTPAIIGGLGAIGTGLALLGFAKASESEARFVSVQPTLPTYNMVGGDVNSIQLAGVMNSGSYKLNNAHYNEIRLSYSLARGFTGKNSSIAIMDAGLDTWHGKTVAELASGPIAPDAKVNSYKITDKDMNFLSYKEIGNIINNAAASNNIFNYSWNTSMKVPSIQSRQDFINKTDANFVNSMINAANNKDAIFVWAAGNEASNQSGALSAAPIFINELNGHFINVVAWDTEKGTLADYSNACGATKDFCITAPGTNINTGKTQASGTSYATPIVSAAIAVIKEAFPYMKAEQITELLFTTARDLGTPGIDEVYGHGMLDLERATRPVGAPLVPISEEVMQPLETARVSGLVANKIKSANLNFAFFDEFGRAFNSNLNDNIVVQNTGKAFSYLTNNKEIYSIELGNIKFGFRQNDILSSTGFLETAENNTTSFISMNNNFNFGNIKFFQEIEFGISAPKATNNSMITGFSNFYTNSLLLGAKYKDLSITISTQNAVLYGNMFLRLPSGRSISGNILYNDYVINMKNTPSIEYTFNYKNLTAGFIDNTYGTDEIYMLLKGKISF